MRPGSLVGSIIIGGGLLAIAVVGWTMALNAIGTLTDLTGKLAVAEAELSRSKAGLSSTSEQLTLAHEDLQQLEQSIRNREELIKQVESHKAELEFLKAQVEDRKAALGRFRTEAKHLQELLLGKAPKYVTTTWARLRAGPSTEAEEVAVVTAGVPLHVLEAVKDGRWYKVGSIGFMYHTLLKPEPSRDIE